MSKINAYCVGADEGGRALVIISILKALLETRRPELHAQVALHLRCLSSVQAASSNALVTAMSDADYKFADMQPRKITQKDIKASDVVLCTDPGVSEFIRGQFYVPSKTMVEPIMNFAPAWKGLRLPRASKMETEDCVKFIRMTEMASMGILNTLKLRARSNAVQEW